MASFAHAQPAALSTQAPWIAPKRAQPVLAWKLIWEPVDADKLPQPKPGTKTFTIHGDKPPRIENVTINGRQAKVIPVRPTSSAGDEKGADNGGDDDKAKEAKEEQQTARAPETEE
mmetsp:Transcript_2266/g.4741  ORF Transcript_2266/g.4741 Transcript_2266/m.4741 type:complete len:116 (+) Transcript_2266:77-424(+)